MTTEILLDSGAYSAKTQKKTIDIDAYAQFIVDNEDALDHYFNLDVIGDGQASFNNYLYLRAAGLRPIPVWHAETDSKFLIEYLQLSDYVAIGAISVMSTIRTKRSLDKIWRNYLTDANWYPICKVHGFGLTSIEIMTRYPWYSVDSTSWVQFGRYGVVLIPQTRNGNWIYNENPHIVTVSNRSPKQGDEYGKHINTLDSVLRKKCIKYISEMGFKMGESEFEIVKGKTVETVVEEGVTNNHLQRDKLNMIYYYKVEQGMPAWPWQLKPDVRRRTAGIPQ